MWADHILLVPSSINGHLACLHLSAVVNYAAGNMGVQITFEDSAFRFFFFFCIYPVQLLGQIVIPIIFLGTTLPFPQQLHPFYIFTNRPQGLHFLHILTDTCYFLCFGNSHFNECEKVRSSHLFQEDCDHFPAVFLRKMSRCCLSTPKTPFLPAPVWRPHHYIITPLGSQRCSPPPRREHEWSFELWQVDATGRSAALALRTCPVLPATMCGRKDKLTVPSW